MELTSEQYKRIQQFADGKMTDTERDAFLLEISNNPDLQESLDLELSLREDLPTWQQTGADIPKEYNRFDDPAYIKSRIKKAGEEWRTQLPDVPGNHEPADLVSHSHNPSSNKKSAAAVRFVWPTIAAAALVAAIVIGFQFFKDPSPQIAHGGKDSARLKKDSLPRQKQTPQIDPQPETHIDYASLFKEYYRKDAPPATSPQLLADAFIGYRDGDYRELQRLDLNNLPTTRGGSEKDQNSPQAIREIGHYYKAIAFIETGNDAKAMTNLNWVVDHADNGELHGKAQYCLALLYIRQGERDKAAGLLEPVAANKKLKPYDASARKLLQLLHKPSTMKMQGL